MKITIKKGLDIPIEGAPEQTVEDAPAVKTVGVVGAGIVGLRPSMLVAYTTSAVLPARRTSATVRA